MMNYQAAAAQAAMQMQLMQMQAAMEAQNFMVMQQQMQQQQQAQQFVPQPEMVQDEEAVFVDSRNEEEEESAAWAKLEALEPQDLLNHVQLPQKNHPTVFDVDLPRYPLQPWQRCVGSMKNAQTEQQATLARKQLSQWFNYGFSPSEFQSYAEKQRAIKAKLSEMVSAAASAV
jgi:hypothetical protein